MASTKPLNAANLERLGAARLATLLIEVATGDAGIKRRLRLALAGEAGADEAAHAIGKRLWTIAKSRSRIDWRKVKGVAGDLAAQHRAIVDLVAPRDPGAALDLLWRFVACAGPVYARSNDGSGRLAEVFDAATASLGPVAIAARIAPAALAERLFDAIRDDDGDMYDALVDALAPALGTAGLEQLRTLVLAWQAEGLVSGEATAARAVEVDRLLVVSGSCSPVTARQYARSLHDGFAGTRADVAALLAGSLAEQERLTEAALAALTTGGRAVIHTAEGPLADDAAAAGDRLGIALGRIAHDVVRRTGLRRVLFAGGDTSSHGVAQLGIDALTWAAPIERGAPLVRAHAADPAIDGIELVLKGGQMGADDFFETVRRGG